MSGKINVKRWLITLAISLGMGCAAFGAQVIYVDGDAVGANDGTSWGDAYSYLQDALADANSAEKPVEIRVAQGIYRPDRSMAEPNGTGDREATFQLINGVAIRGGYAGFGEPKPNERDVALYETVLSGDLAGDDIDVNDPCDLLDEPTRAENSYHVVFAKESDEEAVIDGITISSGHTYMGACDPAGVCLEQYGGAILAIDASLEVRNCCFRYNAGSRGASISSLGESLLEIVNCKFIWNSSVSGGVYLEIGSTVKISSCIFEHNWAENGGGGLRSGANASLFDCTFVNNKAESGGGILNHWKNMVLSNCTFHNNSAVRNGGGIATGFDGSTMSNCTFINNTAESGGGVCVSRGSPAVKNCLFVGNRAAEGGGIMCSSSIVETSNCTFVQNYAAEGSAVKCASEISRFEPGACTLELVNCILWDSDDEIWINDSASRVKVTYSDLRRGIAGIYDPCDGLTWGAGNIDLNPLLADPNSGDYHLKSQAGRWTSASSVEPDANEGLWTEDDVTSPCIDAGDPGGPIGNEPFPNGGIINMGAYGGTSKASKAYFGKPACETIVAGDINGDCMVNFLDFAILAFHWLHEH